MREAREALRALGRAMAAFGTYSAGHPSRDRALDDLFESLARLQEDTPKPAYSFIEGEIIFGAQPLRGEGDWPWAPRLEAVGVQRVEFVSAVDRDDVAAFVGELSWRLRRGRDDAEELRTPPPTGIRYGLVFVEGEHDGAGSGEAESPGIRPIDLRPEVEAVAWIEEELRGGARLHLAEAETVISTLTQAMHGQEAMLLPLVRLKEFDQYTTTHTLNVSVLVMALASELELSAAQVRELGIAALLHDIGKIRIPTGVLNKPGALTDDERKLIQDHTVEGARLLLEQDADLDLAAIVAYEHHRRVDGGGYPEMRVGRRCHDASDLLHVCDVYDALRTHRPYRDGWSHERVMSYLAEEAGTEFREDMVTAFTRMMSKWSEAPTKLEGASPSDPVSTPDVSSPPG